MLERHEIKVSLKADHARSEVATLAGGSLRSVRRVVKERDIERADAASTESKRRDRTRSSLYAGITRDKRGMGRF